MQYNAGRRSTVQYSTVHKPPPPRLGCGIIALPRVGCGQSIARRARSPEAGTPWRALNPRASSGSTDGSADKAPRPLA